jgi:hypothetical protein
MDSGLNRIRNGFLAFAIGLIAGISPFLFMQLLPALLNPGLHLEPPNYLAIILTGALIGIITSIIFATQFEKREPQDIFFYALGIPAILIATVSNMSTEFRAVRQVSEVKESLTSTVLNPPQPEVIHGQQIPLSPPPPASQGRNRTSSATAWAEERKETPGILFAQAGGYFVRIGEYTNEKAAWEDYRKYKDQRLRTELYVSKNLNVFEIRKGVFVLVYGRYSSQEEANKVFQLLRINDPGLDVRILKY